MKGQQQNRSYACDYSILSTWQEQMTKASNNPSLKQQLSQREDELLPRFAEHYEKLKVLPRRVRRSLQRKWKQSLAGVALLLALGQAPAMAATINVGGSCTLVRAIVAANNNTTATGHCKKGSGADTIVLPPNSTQTLTTVNNNVYGYGPTGLPIIRSAITVAGNNSTIRRATSAPKFRIFAVNGAGNLTLQRATVSGGAASGSVPGNSGGGALSRGGTLIITNSTVSGNTASRSGGGLYKVGGTLIIANSTISGNTAASEGGGVGGNYLDGRIINSTISGNKARSGAGLYNGGLDCNSDFLIANSTISRNTATSDGGGIGTGCPINLVRTVVSGNTAAVAAEVYVNGSGGPVTAANFNLFGYKGLTNARAFKYFAPGVTDITATSNGTRPTALAGILNTTLVNNGGPTRTHALVVGSPAIDAVNNGTCPPPARDQRGVKRPQDGNGDGGIACDIGSFERRPPQ